MKISVCGYLSVLCFVNVLRVCQPAMEGYIVGGDYTHITKFPHSAFVTVECQMVGEVAHYICGSSILNSRILMTAAHCLEECLPSSRVVVRVGSEYKLRGQAYGVKSFKLHSQYSDNTMMNDIALICLRKPLNMNRNVKRVALMKYPPEDDTAMVAGWGVVHEISELSPKSMKFCRQTVWPFKKCSKLFKRHMHPGKICANGSYSSDVGFGYVAVGDSGSALVIKGYIAIGVVSYKIPEISPSVTIYTDTRYHIEWIKKYSRKLYCEK